MKGPAVVDGRADRPLVFEPSILRDERGYFFESFNQRDFDRLIGERVVFVQDNHSGSDRYVLRGLHYQLPPARQGKLVRVVEGAIFDVVVDIRRSSPAFLEWEGHELSAENRRQLWVPPGHAHGFLVLSEWAEVLYKDTAHYTPTLSRSLRWDDDTIGIDWPLGGASPILSQKDADAPGVDRAELLD